MDDICVIIPAYNAAATLQRAVDSVLGQTRLPERVVIVDDGSTDGTAALADKMAAGNDLITVVHKPNQGLAEARRTGIGHSAQQWIVHLDSDDALVPDALEWLLGVALKNNLDIAYGSANRIFPNGKSRPQNHPVEGVMTGTEFALANITLNYNYASWGCISRRHLWTDDVFPAADRLIPSEDTLMNVRLGLNAARVGCWNRPVVNYHYLPTSLTATGALHGMERWKDYFAQLMQTLEQRGMADTCRDRIAILKVDRIAFYVRPKSLTLTDSWARAAVVDDIPTATTKTRVLQWLLHFPPLCYLCVTLNRTVKSLFDR